MSQLRKFLMAAVALLVMGSATTLIAPRASAEEADPGWKIWSEMLGCMGDCNGPSGDPDCQCYELPPIIVTP